MSELRAKPELSIKFLRKFRPEGPWVLTAIRTDRKGIAGSTFLPGQEEELKKWLKKYEGDRNIYFHVNLTAGEVTRKAEKTQILKAQWLYVDVDCREGYPVADELDRILRMFTTDVPKGIPRPTALIFSGGGYQAFWRLRTDVDIDGDAEKWTAYESYNKRLEQVFDGDHCHNVERIMRLPGTLNVPNPDKIKRGRSLALASVIEFNDNVYELAEEFKPATPVQTERALMSQPSSHDVDLDLSRAGERINDLTELDEWGVPDRVKIILAQGKHPDQTKPKDNSRSAWLFDAVCHLARCGVPDGIILSIITDPEWGISESVLDKKPNAESYALKQIKSAKQHVEDPHLHWMNIRHAVIGNIGGKCKVIEEVEDEVMGRSRITFSAFEDIRNRYGHKKVQVGVDKEGKPVVKPLGKYWLDHPQRNQFDYMRFMPLGDKEGVYNLWRGFSVNPQPGDCDIYLDHLRNNVCRGNEAYYDYLIKWMARAVQYPASQGEVAIVMRGGKGTGKSIMAGEFGKLFGRHHLHVSNPSHLVGNFNAHLKDVIVLFADEAFFAGDRKHESVLKMLVTEDSIPIEAKHVDVEPYPNYVHLIMAANDPHVIRATGDERRYFVLEVGTAQQQNTQYFGRLTEQMENGGRAALLFYLQSVDISDFQVRNVPQTDALQEQKMLSMNMDEEWWFRKLRDGRLMESDAEWTGVILCDKLVSDFTAYAEKWKITRRGNETALGRFLHRMAPHLERTQRRVMVDQYDSEGRLRRVATRAYVYDFGSLEKCRAAWDRVNGRVEWPEIGEPLEQPPSEPF